ncbi:SMI1/KNR4 family protein [Rothia nasisuis]|uniref:SMI1/KNR4 family protein n=3 Tax=Rothia nasisuis TaxID=2109647 RepID=UPI001F1E4C86|nr:SMI1/KNR4 family protein [Rothia nasisuis]
MSFDSRSELPPHLLALSSLTQWHANSQHRPLELRFTVHGITVENVTTAVTGEIGKTAPIAFTQAATVAVFELALADHFDGSYTVRINATPGGQAIVKQVPITAPTSTEQAEPEPPEPITSVSDNGLRLRTALLGRGHASGYTPAEIAAEEKQRGFTFPPELKFYRMLVRNGVVAEVGGHKVIASTQHADFGASTLDSAPWKAPETANSTVQAVLNHSLWLEIASSPTHLYAIDLAPGATGVAGQVIARRRGEASVPVRIALSLADFVTGQLVKQDASAASPASQYGAGVAAAPASTHSTLAQTIAWVGNVEPAALPGFLRWDSEPTEARYRGVLEQIEPDTAPSLGGTADSEPFTVAPQPVAEQIRFTPQEVAPVEPAQATAVADSQEAAEPVVTEPVVTEPPATEPEATEPEGPGPKAPAPAEKAASLFASQETDLPVTPGTDPASLPTSSESKYMDESAADGTREEYQSANTGSIAARAKKVSLATDSETPQPVEQAEQPRPHEEGGLRLALRRFFIGD